MNPSPKVVPIREITDLELIQAAKKGHHESFGKLIYRYRGRVFLYLKSLTRHHEEAEDLFQETFLKGYKYLHSFREPAPFAPWILKIARHCLLTHRERQGRTPRPVSLETTPHPPAAPNHTAEIVESRNFIERFHRFLSTLNEGYAEAARLRFVGGLSYEEVAKTLGISPGTVMSRLYRVRHSLTEWLGREEKP